MPKQILFKGSDKIFLNGFFIIIIVIFYYYYIIIIQWDSFSLFQILIIF